MSDTEGLHCRSSVGNAAGFALMTCTCEIHFAEPVRAATARRARFGPTPFSRPTIVAATGLLDRHSQAGINRVVIRLGLEADVSSNSDLSVAKKCALIARAIVLRPDWMLDTPIMRSNTMRNATEG
jgi:hypothetical protein